MSFNLNCYYQALERLAALVAGQNRDVQKIRDQYSGSRLKKDEYQQEEERKKKVRTMFAVEFRQQVELLAEQHKQLRQLQPRLAEVINAAPAEAYPAFLVFNRVRLHASKFDKKLAFPHRFPVAHAICVPESEQAALLIQGVMLRLLTSIPIGKLNIYAADPRNGGAALGELRPLLREKSVFPQELVLTKSQEIAATISQLRDMMDARTQSDFTSGCDTWAQYNALHPGQEMSYTVLLLNDALSQLPADFCWQLARLVERGPAAGILPVITYRESDLQDNARKELRTLLPDMAGKTVETLSGLEVFAPSLEPEELPAPELLRNWTESFLSKAAEQRSSLEISNLWKELPLYGETSAAGISAPIGWDADRHQVDFKLGMDGILQHALVAGSTGSGKSNLLHVLIHSLCHRYHPSELQLYMLDFKQGVEFNAYASPVLPHARLIATEGDQEYGISVLSHLCTEMERRNKLFKQHGVPSIAEYRKVSPFPMPRILLIIDEFQKLFEEEGKGGMQKMKPHALMKDLLRLGRSAGIHVLLSTQTLNGLNTGSLAELVGQLGCRLVLKCTESDCQRVLSPMNTAAARISSPPEGVINYAAGDAAANVIFSIPRADAEDCAQHLEAIVLAAPPEALDYQPKVFMGGALPERPAAAPEDQGLEVVQLGEELTFDALPFSVPAVGAENPHLLICGVNKAMHRDILQSIVETYARYDDTDIIWFRHSALMQDPPEKVQVLNSPENLDKLAEIATLMKEETRKKVVLIQNPELCSQLEDPPLVARPVRGQEGVSPRAALDALLAEGAAHGVQVILLAQSPKALSRTACKKLVNSFEHQILFNMNEITARQICGDASLSLREVTQDDRAVYYHSATGETISFRPYHT